MLKVVSNNKLIFIGIHIALGFLCTISFVPKILGITILIGLLAIAFFSENKDEEVLKLSSYIVGIEVFLRMVRGAISYEMGKYGMMIFMFIGFVTAANKIKFNFSYILYIFLLLIGIVFTDVPDGESMRKAIAFNISGPIALGIAALYLYKRSISYQQLMDVLFFGLLPLFSMITYLYFETPDLSKMSFGTSSNFTTSGEFGPNQVATLIGFAMFVIGVFLFLRAKLTGYLILDALFFAYFTFRGLITFSRGGILTAVIAFVAFALFLILYKKGSLGTIFKYIGISIIFVFSIWLYASNLTGGMLENRYKGLDKTGKKKELTSGRWDIFTDQISEFREAPFFGIGVGNGKYKRETEGALVHTSHNEVSRLIEEHGVLGVICLLILLLVPLGHFLGTNNFQKASLSSFLLLWFLTINHSAMRIAFPAFIYGLSLIRITDDGSE